MIVVDKGSSSGRPSNPEGASPRAGRRYRELVQKLPRILLRFVV